MAVQRASGKATENTVTFLLRKQYGTNVEIQRLPDKFDTGQYEDVRISDHIVALNATISTDRGVSALYFIESKETNDPNKKSFSINSTFQKGQLQGMRRAKALSTPYFIAFQLLKTKEVFLVPSFVLLDLLDQNIKSIKVETIRNYPWTTGKIYDYYRERS